MTQPRTKAKAQPRVAWACPECGATPQAHGRRGIDGCKTRSTLGCMGFICECADDGDDNVHGESFDKQCSNAVCYHCDWRGTFPVPPKAWPKWAKDAAAAGWTPPEGWSP